MALVIFSVRVIAQNSHVLNSLFIEKEHLDCVFMLIQLQNSQEI